MADTKPVVVKIVADPSGVQKAFQTAGKSATDFAAQTNREINRAQSSIDRLKSKSIDITARAMVDRSQIDRFASKPIALTAKVDVASSEMQRSAQRMGSIFGQAIGAAVGGRIGVGLAASGMNAAASKLRDVTPAIRAAGKAINDGAEKLKQAAAVSARMIPRDTQGRFVAVSPGAAKTVYVPPIPKAAAATPSMDMSKIWSFPSPPPKPPPSMVAPKVTGVPSDSGPILFGSESATADQRRRAFNTANARQQELRASQAQLTQEHELAKAERVAAQDRLRELLEASKPKSGGQRPMFMDFPKRGTGKRPMPFGEEIPPAAPPPTSAELRAAQRAFDEAAERERIALGFRKNASRQANKAEEAAARQRANIEDPAAMVGDILDRKFAAGDAEGERQRLLNKATAGRNRQQLLNSTLRQQMLDSVLARRAAVPPIPLTPAMAARLGLPGLPVGAGVLPPLPPGGAAGRWAGNSMFSTNSERIFNNRSFGVHLADSLAEPAVMAERMGRAGVFAATKFTEAYMYSIKLRMQATKWASIIGLTGTAIGGALFRSGTSSILADASSAAHLGMGFNDFRAAMLHAGPAGAAMKGGLGSLAEKSALLTRGDIDTTAAFGRLGLGAGFAGQNRADQFDQAAGKIAAIKDPLHQAAAAADVFGEHWVDLLPLLQRGAGGMDEAREAARRFGLTANAVDVSNVREAANVMHKMGAIWEGLKTQFTLGIAPIVNELAKTFDVAAVDFSNLKNTVMDAAQGMAQAGAIVIDSFSNTHIVAKAWDVAADAITAGIRLTMRTIVEEGQAAIIKMIPGGALGQSIATAAGITANMAVGGSTVNGKTAIEQAKEDMGKVREKAGEFWKEAQNGRAVQNVNDLFSRARSRANAAPGAVPTIVNPELLKQVSMQQFAGMSGATRNPWEAFEQAQRDIAQMDKFKMFFGPEGAEKKARFAQKAFADLSSSGLAPETRFAGAAEQGSREAYSAITQYLGSRDRESIQERIANLQMESKELLKAIKEIGEATLKATENASPATPTKPW